MQAVCVVGSPRAKGSTSALVGAMARALGARGVRTRVIRLGEMDIGYCRGCKACERTGTCVQADDVRGIMEAVFAARLVIVASPSYWGDVTGQMKVWIDRCTPYGNTNPARRACHEGILGAAVAVRAGGGREENLRLVGTIGHFLGHLEIPLAGHFTVEGIGSDQDLAARPQVIKDAYAFGETLWQQVWGEEGG